MSIALRLAAASAALAAVAATRVAGPVAETTGASCDGAAAHDAVVAAQRSVVDTHAATRTARHTARAQLDEAQAFEASCSATTSTG